MQHSHTTLNKICWVPSIRSELLTKFMRRRSARMLPKNLWRAI